METNSDSIASIYDASFQENSDSIACIYDT